MTAAGTAYAGGPSHSGWLWTGYFICDGCWRSGFPSHDCHARKGPVATRCCCAVYRTCALYSPADDRHA